MSGRRTRLAPRVTRPAPQPVITLREDAEPMRTALRLAGGDRSRVRVVSETEVLVVNGGRR
ncbi:hypothetical protein N865_19700 [Intrasporangium oryzae NRRL B-24470]|uniref:Uncharacterized protein n=1 Tax=Intrasporangium oryzae NRRL B-24470 TaxID=1386089 RepID=W9G7V3_9MICO|nr:hypothetical protein N865_19700 [Intrasporangium oryzae NRRL B-24470]